ncbi:uncharacterized protein [Littorina saxatilis]|uniref:Uncharacterized protein n=1 Tax=Littorina saxatilis TaxID=31220 RepID=A0AAN9G1B7_9CAEN
MMYLVVLALCLPAILAQGFGTPTPQIGGFQPGLRFNYQPGFPYPYGINYGNPCIGSGSRTQQCVQQYQQCSPGGQTCCPGTTCRQQYGSFQCLPSFGFDEAQATDAPTDVAADAAV